MEHKIENQRPCDSGTGILVLDTPVKSESDKKEYRIIKLPNKLTALLISDPTPHQEKNDELMKDGKESSSGTEDDDDDDNDDDGETGDNIENNEDDNNDKKTNSLEKLAACSLLIDVGSFSDPHDIQGLAHFLEHMIFMGSEKYPTENEYDQYIKKFGGSDNAYTECEETCFYFDVAEPYFDGALDRFSSLFKSPLMLREAMTRERDSVESEFKMKHLSGSVRKDGIMLSMGNPVHPSSLFCWGNFKTLKDNIDDDLLYERVHEFRRKHYSAHRMYVCLQARRSLDVLQENAVKYFSDIPNNNEPFNDFEAIDRTNIDNVFLPIFSEKVFYMDPIENASKIYMTWCLPSMIKLYKSKPWDYVSHLINYEGTGSLCSYLRRKLWSTELIAGVNNGYEFNSLYMLYTITIKLTDSGYDNIKSILEAVFSYLKFLLELGPNISCFNELKQIEDTNFRFITEQDPVDSVSDLVSSLKDFPPQDVLTGSELYFEYQPDEINKILTELNRIKLNIIILSKHNRLKKNIDYDLMDPWFDIKYTMKDFPMEWKNGLENVRPFDEFQPIPVNPFIATDFTILFDKNSAIERTDLIGKYPKKIFENNVCELWYRLDDKFLLPIAKCMYYFQSPLALESPANFVMMYIFVLILKNQLIEKLYLADCAGFDISVKLGEKGFLLTISGYNQHIHIIIDYILDYLKDFCNNIEENVYEMFVEQLHKDYHNLLIKPSTLANDLRLMFVNSPYDLLLNKYKALKTINVDKFRSFSARFVKEFHIKSLIQGNIEEDKAKTMTMKILQSLGCESIQDPSLLQRVTVKLPIGSHYLCCKSLNETNVNTIVMNHYEIGPISIETKCLLSLLIAIASEPLYDTLRTKEQLGYSVDMDAGNNNGVLCYTIFLNSQEDKFTANYVESRIEYFREKLIDIIRDMSSKDFEHFKETLIKTQLIDDIELKDEMNRNWREIVYDEYIFNRKTLNIEYIKSISQNDLLEFYQSHYGNGKEKKISVQVIGNNKPESMKAANKMNADQNKIEENDENAVDQNLLIIDDIKFLEMYPENNVTDIQAFKNTLKLYPICKTNPTTATTTTETV